MPVEACFRGEVQGSQGGLASALGPKVKVSHCGPVYSEPHRNERVDKSGHWHPG